MTDGRSDRDASADGVAGDVLAPPPADTRLGAPAARAVDPVAAGEALDRSFAAGLLWTAGARWASQLVSWGVTILVANLLSPTDYGIVGMSALLVGFIALVGEFGLGLTVVRYRDLSAQELAAMQGLALVVGLTSLAIGCALAVPLGAFFRSPQLPAVVAVQSLGFVIAAGAVVPAGLLQRDLRFRALAGVEVCRAFAAAVVAAALALGGFGYWTFGLAELGGTTAATLAILATRRQPVAWPRPARLARVATFSVRTLVDRVAWYTYLNADFLLVGRLLQRQALGVYTFAWTLTNLPVEKITALVSHVSPAYFSALQDDRAGLRRYVLALTEGLATLALPMTVGLALVADDFVALAFGAKWQGAVVPIRLLAVSMAWRAVAPVLHNALLMLGDARFLMYQGLACALTFPAAFYAGLRMGGLAGLAATWLVIYPISQLPVLWRTVTRIMPARVYAGAFRPAVEGTLAMCVTVAAVRLLLPRPTGRADAALPLAAQIAIGAGTYALVLWLRHRGRLEALLALRRQAREG